MKKELKFDYLNDALNACKSIDAILTNDKCCIVIERSKKTYEDRIDPFSYKLTFSEEKAPTA